ncbi:hypothetical protein SAMN02745126_05796 [Enhydrobacter aerosaccus]|uniref:Glycosyl transferase family 2 n=1 Tax=Enhydrobacter aerosaccus TaxID=225324 RepID=A0A1T4T712_9HYPH|nr:hypothetical protein [Enhydrobacter aerosaccus]SKA36266.1 hypothetical protein SAMN02745126_05796 [Enhydrobacter aerosaccus]
MHQESNNGLCKAKNSIAVGYLIRGADKNWRESIDRFVAAYQTHPAGAEHELYVIAKGFASRHDLACALATFRNHRFSDIHVADDSFDIGAYAEAARLISEDYVCFFNSHAAPVSDNWLAKLHLNLEVESVGLVGATGSYESLHDYDSIFPRMPNVHVRSNAFMISREQFCAVTDGLTFKSKLDAFLFESGPQSMTRRILDMGQSVRLVGSNGRGYTPRWWPLSDTFRLRRQENLLVSDNQTRNYDASRWPEKRTISERTWGNYLQERFVLKDKTLLA